MLAASYTFSFVTLKGNSSRQIFGAVYRGVGMRYFCAILLSGALDVSMPKYKAIQRLLRYTA